MLLVEEEVHDEVDRVDVGAVIPSDEGLPAVLGKELLQVAHLHPVNVLWIGHRLDSLERLQVKPISRVVGVRLQGVGDVS